MIEKPNIMNDLKSSLNIAAYQANVSNLGPGKRFAIWVQGCPFNCKNCVAPEWIPFTANNVVSIQDFSRKILSETSTDGITISGGEPMMQARRLNKLLEIVKSENPKLNVIVFSGFKLKQLQWEDAQMLLANIDVLVDGLYIDSLNNNMDFRGSSNQTIHYLSDRLVSHKDYFESYSRQLEFHHQSDGILMTGIPVRGFEFK